ncbi:MAG: hypothetical protein HC803_01910 [Saprospiraceae bacterium]|nr:hypothetical protein [Saprospiraceae bacterium]
MDARKGTQIISNQVADLLDIINNQYYSQSLSTFNGSSVGQHIRHVIDFYLCLISGSNDFINYDNRERNPLIETDCLTAKNFIEIIAQKVQSMDIEQKVMVSSSFVDDEEEQLISIPSSVGRELMYAYDHAIHHLAMIKIGMQIHFPEIAISKDLGVAPSTLKYRKQCAQ